MLEILFVTAMMITYITLIVFAVGVIIYVADSIAEKLIGFSIVDIVEYALEAVKNYFRLG